MITKKMEELKLDSKLRRQWACSWEDWMKQKPIRSVIQRGSNNLCSICVLYCFLALLTYIVSLIRKSILSDDHHIHQKKCSVLVGQSLTSHEYEVFATSFS